MRVGMTYNAAFGDYEKDGYLDIYISGYIEFDIRNPPDPRQFYCAYRGKPVEACGPRGLKGAPDVLYRNNGDGTFSEVTEKAGVTDQGLYSGFAVAFEDFDGDGWPDIIVLNDSNPNYFYRNKGTERLRKSERSPGLLITKQGLSNRTWAWRWEIWTMTDGRIY